ncbi:MAG: hypothetical protein Q4A07_12525 [Coriobacteriales bacterium]|nr:hypothetical protein [Coriobacteriales bacterium]
MKATKRNRRLVMLASLCVTAVFALLIAVRPALAGTDPFAFKISELKGNVTLYCNSTAKPYSAGKSYTYKGKLTDYMHPKIQKILAVNTYGAVDEGYLFVEASGLGTGKVSYKYKGKTYKATVRVKKYTNPVKKLNIGTKKLAGKFNKQNTFDTDFAKLKNKKISITPAKGWKVQKIVSMVSINGGLTNKMLKNGAKVPDGALRIVVRMQNTSTKGTIDLTLSQVLGMGK